MIKPIPAVIAALVALTPLSCDSDTPTGPTQPLNARDFPMELGTRWVYHVQDTMRDLQDTVDVEIISSLRGSAGELVTEWRYSFHNQTGPTDTTVLTVLGDSAWFSPLLQLIVPWDVIVFPCQFLSFPLEIGKYWRYRIGGGMDSSIVVEQVSTITPQGPLPSFRIETVAITAYDYFGFSELWVSRYVGIVRATLLRGFRRPETAAIWTLIEYVPADDK